MRQCTNSETVTTSFVRVYSVVALQAGPDCRPVLIRQFHPSPRTRGREGFLVHILEVLDDDRFVRFGPEILWGI